MGPMKIYRNLSGSQGLSSQVQTLAAEIESLPISPKRYQQLQRRLDTTFKAVRYLETDEKASNVFLRAQAESLKERCVTLYQQLEDGLVNNEISLILKESEELKHSKITSKAVQALETHIDSLLENHAPSLEQNRALRDAKKTLQEAKARLEGKEVPSHFDWLSQQQDVRSLEAFELIPQEIEDVFDVAKAVYDQNLKKAKIHFQLLPEAHKNRFFSHMRYLGAEPFVDLLETIQALIATANDLAKNPDLYPTKKQIETLFSGLNQVNKDEMPEKTSREKIFLFRSTAE